MEESGEAQGEGSAGELSVSASSGSADATDAAAAGHGSGEPMGTELHAASTSEQRRRVTSRQTDLMGWLKRDS